ncbi:hypothetical protein H7I39_18630 [Mycobacterium doricum]|uniref:Uncharacterized protein n=1 Tax=Mycolicibacterium doricum TaxID=126673 RepID=A0A1X1T2Q5_9MYCO|nr:hypothetical protein [Mycolicibacterium doricum]ORV38525.1 hypothetical protein AWC01_14580 [Mycolicibacterium doricum]
MSYGEYPPPLTAAELIRRLAALPPDTPVLVDGPAAAFSPIAATQLVEVQELDRVPVPELGRFDATAEAARNVADPPGAVAAQPIGSPRMALVLRREQQVDDEDEDAESDD